MRWVTEPTVSTLNRAVRPLVLSEFVKITRVTRQISQASVHLNEQLTWLYDAAREKLLLLIISVVRSRYKQDFGLQASTDYEHTEMSNVV
ncbi:hypothetical protein CYMTET_3348 [Cymbomonas tetramitiformis]|uniref:Uncharacterized protein n=1 Tax=Cymbomonas tetramitiformis TaxID=36881 RepID=A0AAE0H3X1_9CHLO|nr:hypothetical protein CYMTET_3348 [Cymbomonas tetramitiformis]